MDNEYVVLEVRTDPEKSTYTVKSCQDSSVNEMAFAVAVVIKVLVRDGLVKSKSQFDKLVKKYFTDSQYAEVEDVDRQD